MKTCNFCRKPLEHTFLDLGFQPPSNSFLTKEQLDEPETTYPLKVFVCTSCWLVQVPESKKAAEIFSDDYIYYSSQSPANISHAKEYVKMMCKRFGYGENSQIIEIGSNDGYLLKQFPGHVPVLGFEPSNGPATVAMGSGIPTTREFFNTTAARTIEGKTDLICSINTIAHQPDINDFVEGIRIALKPDGVTTHEFPWLLKTVEGLQFDQFYAEHYSYFSLSTICAIFQKHGLEVFDVDFMPEHGGSLRIYATHTENRNRWLHFNCLGRIGTVENRENEAGIHGLEFYQNFQSKVEKVRSDFMRFLVGSRVPPSMLMFHSSEELLPGSSAFKPRRIWYRHDQNKETSFFMMGGNPKICAYGAPAKANTFLNYCKVTPDLLSFTVDISPHKQGLFMPGSHIPVLTEEDLINYRPDYVVILAWNLKQEIMEQLKYVKERGGHFVIAIPGLEVI